MIRSTKLGPLTWMHAKYGSWTPSRTYLPAKTVLVHNTPNLGCLLKHGCTWQIRCSGRSAPIFWGRTRFWYSKWMHNRFWGLNIQKIDFALIFSVLAQPQIWGDHFQDAENRRDINFFDAQSPKLIYINFGQLNISPHAKYWGQTPSNELKQAKTVVVCYT